MNTHLFYRKILWGTKILQSPPTVPYTDVMSNDDKGLFKWLEWMVEDGCASKEKKVVARGKSNGRLTWAGAIVRIKKQLQNAVAARGLGPMSL